MATADTIEQLVDELVARARQDHPGLFDTPEHSEALESMMLEIFFETAEEAWRACAMSIAEHLDGMLDEDLLEREMPAALQNYVRADPVKNYVEGLLGVRDLAVDIARQVAEGNDPIVKSKAEMEAEYQSYATAERVEPVEQEDGSTKLVPIAKKMN